MLPKAPNLILSKVKLLYFKFKIIMIVILKPHAVIIKCIKGMHIYTINFIVFQYRVRIQALQGYSK